MTGDSPMRERRDETAGSTHLLKGMAAGAIAALGLIVHKLVGHEDIMTSHGPLMIFSAVLILAGVQMLALGLLGALSIDAQGVVTTFPRDIHISRNTFRLGIFLAYILQAFHSHL